MTKLSHKLQHSCHSCQHLLHKITVLEIDLIRQLPDRISRITYCNFTVRMLYRNMYWLIYILDMRFVLFLCTTAVWQLAINEYVMLCYRWLQIFLHWTLLRPNFCSLVSVNNLPKSTTPHLTPLTLLETLASYSMNTSPFLTRSHLCPNSAITMEGMMENRKLKNGYAQKYR